MPSQRFSLMFALVVAAGLGLHAKEARAGLQLQLTNGNFTETVDASTPGRISYFNDSFNNGNLSIDGTLSKSTSLTDGPNLYSQLSISSFTITNLSKDTAQTLTLALSDSGFDPDSEIRPLMIFNTASATSTFNGHFSYQTFAFDGNENFKTSGPGVVATDAVDFGLPFSGSNTTTALFTPISTQFSITSVVTIQLAAGASLVGFNGASLVHAPEPGTIALALSGVPALALVVLRRRRASRAA